MKLSELKKQIKEEILEILADPEDQEAIDSAERLKSQGDKLNKVIIDLAQTEKEMQRLAKQWKQADGAEKESLLQQLKDKTKIKKELESLKQRLEDELV
jgi:hypothetical protein